MTLPPYPPQQLRHVPLPPPHLHSRRQGSPNPDAASSSLRWRGLPSDARGLRAVIKALSASGSAWAAAVHAHATKLGMDRERTVRNALISLYLCHGDRTATRALFDDGVPCDAVTWTAMVIGHARLRLFDEAAVLFLAMLDDDLAVDAVAAAAEFAACAEAGSLALAREAHRRVAAREVPLDVVAWNALIDMYASCGDVASARRWFDKVPMTKRSVVTWNTMISALTRAGRQGDALALFREMQQQGADLVQPDDATLVAVLGACARLGVLDAGRWVHAYHARRRRSEVPSSGVTVSNALIDMYAKCGAIEHALAVFAGTAATRRDAYTYASTIQALATHGRAGDALALLGARPDAVGLLGALSACRHAGRVGEGLRLLRAMEADSYGAVPGVEHYGCAVDMLGRAGRLDDAEALAAAMPVPPDARVRGSLLAACRAHGDVERAERVMRWRLRDDADAGDHVLLANAYASVGRHGSAVRVRRRMRRRRIVKVPGCSVIEIDGVVHEFRAVPANSIE
jgi:pentatricopeptide repeat protein